MRTSAGTGKALQLYLSLVAGLFLCSREASAQGADAPLSDRLKVLDRFIGTWQNVDTEPTLFNRTVPAEEYTFSRVLGGQFVQGQVKFADKITTMWMYTYDTNQKCYRFWRFPSMGRASEATGQWDADTKTIRWTYVGCGPEITTTARTRFVNDNTFEFDSIFRSGAEVVHQESLRYQRLE